MLPRGVAEWLITASECSAMSLGEVVVLPGQSHEWHVHEDSDEVVYVLGGRGALTIRGKATDTIGPGDALHIPAGIYHDSHNQGWSPLHLSGYVQPSLSRAGRTRHSAPTIQFRAPLAMSTSVPAAAEEDANAPSH